MKNFLLEIKLMFCGGDGKLSARRILGFALIIFGVVLLAIAKEPQPDSWISFAWSAIGVVPIGIGAYFFGIITDQNIKDWTKKDV